MSSHVGYLLLPEARIEFSAPRHDDELLIVAGGRAPSNEWLRAAARGRDVWCADRGCDACRAAGVSPSRVIGDADSADAASWEWAERRGAVVERFPSAKDLTDTQLALRRAQALSPRPLVVLSGALGGRLDHAFSVIYSFAASRLSGCVADDRELLFVLGEKERATVEPSRALKALSLLPLTPECEGVFVSGTRWRLSDATLRQRDANAVSNELSPGSGGFSVENGSGLLAIYVCWDETGL